MQTRCFRQGQVEVGVIEHGGREFAALGASVVGRNVTGYTKLVGRQIRLTAWCGKTMLACRSEVVERYRDGSLVLIFRLTAGRLIVGYALAESGMLFRGELLVGYDDHDARQAARRLGEHFADLDAEDEERFAVEEDETPA